MKISILGVGNMGTLLLESMLKKKLVTNEDVIVSDISSARLKEVSDKYNVKSYLDNLSTIENQDVIIIAVKPLAARSVYMDIQNKVQKPQIIISIVAGFTISSMELLLGDNKKIVRAMPNTPTLVSAGITAISNNQNVSVDEMAEVCSLFETVGEVVQISESDMDAATGLSGSGPAYIMTVIEALSDGGVKMGLSREIALKLATHTVLGSAKLLLETGEHPAILREKVTSPAGTTCAGLHALEQGRIRHAFTQAVEDATKRSKELGASN